MAVSNLPQFVEEAYFKDVVEEYVQKIKKKRFWRKTLTSLLINPLCFARCAGLESPRLKC